MSSPPPHLPTSRKHCTSNPVPMHSSRGEGGAAAAVAVAVGADDTCPCDARQPMSLGGSLGDSLVGRTRALVWLCRAIRHCPPPGVAYALCIGEVVD